MSREMRFEHTYGGGRCVDKFVAYGHPEKYTLCTETFLDGKSMALATISLAPEQAKALSLFMAGAQARSNRINGLALAISDAIEADLNDRRGLHLDVLSEEIQRDIRRAWWKRIKGILEMDEAGL